MQSPLIISVIAGLIGFVLSRLLLTFSQTEASVQGIYKRYRDSSIVLALLVFGGVAAIFYNTGKWLKDESYLEESIKYYEDAAEIYENYKKSDELRQMQICVTKADEYIKQL